MQISTNYSKWGAEHKNRGQEPLEITNKTVQKAIQPALGTQSGPVSDLVDLGINN